MDRDEMVELNNLELDSLSILENTVGIKVDDETDNLHPQFDNEGTLLCLFTL